MKHDYGCFTTPQVVNATAGHTRLNGHRAASRRYRSRRFNALVVFVCAAEATRYRQAQYECHLGTTGRILESSDRKPTFRNLDAFQLHARGRRRCVPQHGETSSRSAASAYLNLFDRGNPFGGSRPASARLPRQSDSSFKVSENARPAASVQVRPSAPLKVFTSDSPPSL